MSLKISVIVPSYNGAHKLPNILSSLSRQSFNDFETIVVLDGSTDNSLEILENTDFGLKNLKIINQANGGRSVSRNNGAKTAEGELLVFFDDDVRLLNNCIEKHWKHYLHYQDCILVGNVPEDLAVMKNDFQFFKANLSRKWVENLPDSNIRLSKKNLFLTAANLSIKKELFWCLGGFDEKLTDSEDYDLGVKALLKDVPIYFDINNIVWHDDFITCRSYVIRSRQYSLSHKKLKELKPELYNEEFTQYDYRQVKGFKKAVYSFFGRSFWVKLIDSNKWLLFPPKKLRYKIYDFVITSLSAHSPNRKI